MKELKGTKTEQNLWEAFAGESQARNKYTYFASKAKKDGYVQPMRKNMPSYGLSIFREARSRVQPKTS